MTLTTRVVKVGGSLFSFDQLPERAQQWLDRESPGITIFIGGGGDLIKPLREAHERFRLDEEGSHWLAVRAMTVSSRLLATLIDVELVERWEVVEQLIQAGRRAACVLDVEDFLRRRELQIVGSPLPRDWTCSSDSIAARVAAALSADELVLWKSIPLAPGMDYEEAARQGLVDSWFPQAAAPLSRIRWVCLRDLPASPSGP
jgi:5-(aminomethyl)-3-furanmethanol phosphate kinase